ncbi:unnamed protein product [Thlaspi arvense]|uniref:Gnk2-homologous domain-containing protein n=1 Tax=Thlaspi arvense TaxID=13288 RepID=A0AAU9S0Y4_THLAR|nr:unnamed protein product [Thlaspi arvense]
MTNAYVNHKCFASQGKYKPGSKYEKDLKDIIKSIPLTSNFSTGYEMMSLGKGPSYVSAVLQCRGDSYGPRCRSCYDTALSELQRRCPRFKGGIIWYDQCLLEISAIDTIGQVDYNNNLCVASAKNVTGDKDMIQDKWVSLVSNLTGIAINEKNLYQGRPALYAAGETRLGTKETMFAMVQCTKDLSVTGCQVCVGSILVGFQDCWRGKRGMRVLGRSCNFRFELYPFINSKASPKYLET